MQECELSSERRGLAFFQNGRDLQLGGANGYRNRREATISCGRVAPEPFKLYDFPLVTLISVLY